MAEVVDWSSPCPGQRAVLNGVQHTGVLQHFTADHKDLHSVQERISSGRAPALVSSCLPLAEGRLVRSGAKRFGTGRISREDLVAHRVGGPVRGR